MTRTAYLKKYRQENKHRTKRVSLTFSKSEYAVFERSAKNAGVKIAPHIKALSVLSLYDEISLPDTVEDQLASFSKLLRTVANNLNQIARHSNRVREVLDEHEPLVEIQILEQRMRQEIELLARQRRGS